MCYRGVMECLPCLFTVNLYIEPTDLRLCFINPIFVLFFALCLSKGNEGGFSQRKGVKKKSQNGKSAGASHWTLRSLVQLSSSCLEVGHGYWTKDVSEKGTGHLGFQLTASRPWSP
jgi:hypothetical protein